MEKENVEYNEQFIKYWFDKFNKKYFKNQLKEIPLSWCNKTKSTFFCCANVELKKIQPIRITLSKKNITDFNSFRNHLVHEMVHYYVNCYLLEPNKYTWMEFVRIYKNKGKEKAYRYLLGEHHNSMWLSQASTLNKKFKELDITAFQHDSVRNREDSNLHLIEKVTYDNEKSRGKSRYYCLSDSRLKKLKRSFKHIKNTPRNDYYEVEVYRDKLTHSIHETKEGYYLLNKYIYYLEKQNALGFAKFLGSTEV